MAFTVGQEELPDFSGQKIKQEKLPDFSGKNVSDFDGGIKPVKLQSQSIINDNKQVVNTEVTYGKKVNFMTETQANQVPREQYFGMQKIEEQSIQDYIGENSNVFQDFSRGVANTIIGTAQDIKRFGQKVGAKAIIQATLDREGVKGKEREERLSEWNNLIAKEIQGIAETNQKYREGLGIAKATGDALTFDLGGVFAQLGLSVASKSPTAMASLFGMQQQQTASEEIFKNLGDAEKAEIVGGAIAIPVAALEFIGLDKFLKIVKSNTVVSSTVKGFATEALQEGSQAVVEEVGLQTFGGRIKSFEDTMRDIGYQMILGGIGGGTVGGMVSYGNNRLKEDGMPPEQAKKTSESIANNIMNSQEIHKETANIIRDQNDNTTNYGNNVENGIAEVNKAIQVERSKIAESEKAQQEQQKLRDDFLKEKEEAIDVNNQDFLNSLQDDAVYLQTVDKLVDEARGQNKELSQEDLINIATQIETIELADEQDRLVEEISKGIPEELIFQANKIKDAKTVEEAVNILRESPHSREQRRAFRERYNLGFEDITEQKALNAVQQFLSDVQEISKPLTTLEELEETDIDFDKARELKEQKQAFGIDFQKVKDLQKVIDFKSGLKPIEVTDEQGVISPLGEVLKQVRGIEQGRGIDVKVNNNFLKQEEIRNTKFLKRTRENASGLVQNVGDAFNSVIEPVASTIQKISPKLWIKVEKYLYKAGIESQKSVDKMKPFNDKFRKLDRKQFNEMDFYMKNITIKEGAIGFKYKERLDVLLKETGMATEFNEVRKELNRIYKELIDVGVDVGFLENYIPRMVDPKQKEAFLSYLKGSEQYSPLISALEQEKFYNDMSLEERAKFVNNYLRGFIPKDIITLSRIGNIKFQRTIQEIDGDLNQFYLKTSDALIKYVEATTKLIEQKKLFGTENQDMATLRTAIKRKRTQLDNNIKKDAGKEKIAKVENELKTLEEQVELMSSGSLQDSVGQIVYDLASKETLTSREEQLIKRSLSAIIDAKATPKGVQLIKNIQYALTLGNVKTTISQIGDLGLSIYKNGYIPAIKATISKKQIDVRDLGIDSIMEELSTRDGMSKFIDKELTWTGLKKLDITMKNVDANSNLINTRNLLKKGNTKINEELDFIFDEYKGQAEQVKKDILNGINSEDVGYYIYSKLSQTQPINIASMPLSYLENPNTRYMYSLKTFALTQLNFARKQILTKMRKEPLTAFKNLIKLQTALMLMGATKDFIKSFWDDEELDMGEVLLNNIIIYNLIGRYNVEQAFYRGTGSAALNLVTPPIIGIVDKVQRGKFLDVVPFGKDFKVIKEKID